MSADAAGRARMRALVLHGIGDLRLEEVARPCPGDGEVLVRVGFCGVCGSDIPRIFVKGTYRFPTICGHEFAGVVQEAGPGVRDFAPGDRVGVFPLLWCGACAACEDGRYAQCSNYDYLGSRSDGAFAEYIVAPRENLLRVPEAVSLEAAAVIEPAAVALHALRRAGGTGPGEIVAVFGAGPIGLLVAQWARSMGASSVAVFDVVEDKLRMASSMGFSVVHHAGREDPLEVVGALSGGEGAHVSVDAAGVPDTVRRGLAATRREGRFVLLGNPSDDVTLPAGLVSQAMRREIVIFGTWNSSYRARGGDDDWHVVVDALSKGTIDPLPLVTHRVPLERSADTLRAMRDGRELFTKVLIHP